MVDAFFLVATGCFRGKYGGKKEINGNRVIRGSIHLLQHPGVQKL
jgi:hypothetical protein